MGLADDAQMLVDADVAALVAAAMQRSALEVLAVRPHAEGAEPDVGDELAAVCGRDGDRGERRGRSAGQLGDRRAQPQLDVERIELAAQLVPQGLVVGAVEDVLGDVGDRDVLDREERLDLAGRARGAAGPAPTIRARSAASSASWAARCRARAEAMSGASVLAGNG